MTYFEKLQEKLTPTLVLGKLVSLSFRLCSAFIPLLFVWLVGFAGRLALLVYAHFSVCVLTCLFVVCVMSFTCPFVRLACCSFFPRQAKAMNYIY